MDKSFTSNEELIQDIQRHLAALEDWGVAEEIEISGWPPSYSPGPAPPTPELLPAPPAESLEDETLLPEPASQTPSSSPLKFEAWFLGLESPNNATSTFAHPSPSPTPLSSPSYKASPPLPPASPDFILIYNQEEEIYYEVMVEDARLVGEIEAMDAEAIVLESPDI